MNLMYKYFYIFFILYVAAQADVVISVSKSIDDSLNKFPLSNKSLVFKVEDTEEKVYESFVSRRVKVAIMREDILKELYQNSTNQSTYYILGKIKIKSILCYASKLNENNVSSGIPRQRISVGLLGNRGATYFKNFIAKTAPIQEKNILSLDPYRSIDRFIKGGLDGIFLFASDAYAKNFSNFLSPYSSILKRYLSEDLAMHCPKKEALCYYNYFLIASIDIGKGTMSNIYDSSDPLIDHDNKLSFALGSYYVPTNIKKLLAPMTKQEHVGRISMKLSAYSGVKSPKFGRAPWMDVAVREAIIGKGKPENVFPMLDLSYKYIRFSKGKSGITTAPNDNREGSWCAAFVCWSLNRAGYKIHKRGRMASQSFRYYNGKIYKKIDHPIFGAITLYTKINNPAHGHVGYLFGKTPSGRFVLLGGNQNNRLKFSSYSYSFGSYRLNGFYVPVSYKITKKDKLTQKDVYPSAQFLNKKYGIIGKKKRGGSNSVR